jgi:flagellar basal-body rod protein FlgB
VLDGLFGEHGAILQTALAGTTKRSLAINENIANVDTPRYKRRQVEFESQLQRYRRIKRGNDNELAVTQPVHMGHIDLWRTHGGHMDIGPWSLPFPAAEWRAESTAFRLDENNVDMDYEMTLLSQTELTYNAVASFMRKKFEGLQGVIRGQ